MISIDDQKARQVWSRVMNCSAGQSASAEGCLEQRADQALSGLKEAGKQLTEDVLAELLQDEWTDAGTYRKLAACAPTCAKTILLRIAQEELCHARTLSALYYLKTGKKYCPEGRASVCTACFNETIRQRYQAELAGQARYTALSGAAGEHQSTFEQFACDEGRHAQMLCCILQNTL